MSEARLVKKKHIEELKQLEKSDPEWLLELKKQDEQAALEETLRKKVTSRSIIFKFGNSNVVGCGYRNYWKRN
jgi:hypothetical protein